MAAYQLLDAQDGKSRSRHGCVRLVSADPDPLARVAVREGMQARSDVLVVTEAATSVDAIAAIREYAPDVILADTELPPAGAVAATVQFRALDPGVRVILFSVHLDEQLALPSPAGGAGPRARLPSMRGRSRRRRRPSRRENHPATTRRRPGGSPGQVLLEGPGVEPDSGLEPDGIAVEDQALAYESLEVEQRLSERLPRLGIGPILPQQ